MPVEIPTMFQVEALFEKESKPHVPRGNLSLVQTHFCTMFQVEPTYSMDPIRDMVYRCLYNDGSHNELVHLYTQRDIVGHSYTEAAASGIIQPTTATNNKQQET